MTADAPRSGSLPSIQLSLRFQAESFDPDEITRRLGIEPTTISMPGAPITPDGLGRGRRYGWKLAVEERETLELGTLLNVFGPAAHRPDPWSSPWKKRWAPSAGLSKASSAALTK